MNDSEIIDLFFERSEQAIVELSKKYGNICKHISINILNDPLDVEECINDAYLGIWNSVPPQRPNLLLAYVCRVVQNLSIKRYHFNTAEKRNSKYSLALDELEECIAAPNNNETDREVPLLDEIIDNFLSTLSRDNRVMFIRRYWFSDSISEIAGLFGIPEHNVSARLCRIRKRMREYLTKKGVVL